MINDRVQRAAGNHLQPEMPLEFVILIALYAMAGSLIRAIRANAAAKATPRAIMEGKSWTLFIIGACLMFTTLIDDYFPHTLRNVQQAMLYFTFKMTLFGLALLLVMVSAYHFVKLAKAK